MSQRLQTTFVFRELTTYEDLKAAFHLRWKERIELNYPYLKSNNDCNLDIDAFDVLAYHFGIFEQTVLGNTLIGCFRFITEQATPIAKIIKQLAFDHSTILPYRIIKPTDYVFHSFKIFQKSPALLAIYEQWKNENRRICEVGRLTLYHIYRDVQLARFLIESAITVCQIHHYDAAFITVAVPHQPAYRRFGFKVIPELDGYIIGELNHSAMTIKQEDIPKIIADKCQHLAAVLRDEGAFVQTLDLERNWGLTPSV
jgi:predicted GNAT family N-acyltransferase